MKSDRLGLIHKDQRAVTLVELMIAIALAGIVTAGITMMVSNVFAASVRTSNHMTAVRQVQSAEYWLSRDVRQASPSDIDLAPLNGQFLVLTWSEWDDEGEGLRVVKAEYTLEGESLRRTLSLEDLEDPGEFRPPHSDTIIAEHMNPIDPYWDEEDETRVLVFVVTATVGDTDVTMPFKVKPRLG